MIGYVNKLSSGWSFNILNHVMKYIGKIKREIGISFSFNLICNIGLGGKEGSDNSIKKKKNRLISIYW